MQSSLEADGIAAASPWRNGPVPIAVSSRRMFEADSTGPVATDLAPPIVRPKWWTQIVLVAAVWWLYDKINKRLSRSS